MGQDVYREDRQKRHKQDYQYGEKKPTSPSGPILNELQGRGPQPQSQPPYHLDTTICTEQSGLSSTAGGGLDYHQKLEGPRFLATTRGSLAS